VLMSMHNFVAISGAVCINKEMFMDVMWIIPTIVLMDMTITNFDHRSDVRADVRSARQLCQ